MKRLLKNCYVYAKGEVLDLTEQISDSKYSYTIKLAMILALYLTIAICSLVSFSAFVEGVANILLSIWGAFTPYIVIGIIVLCFLFS